MWCKVGLEPSLIIVTSLASCFASIPESEFGQKIKVEDKIEPLKL